MTPEKRARQKRTVIILAVVLITGGLFVLLALERMPLPLRLIVGLSDLFAGLILLVVARQKFSAPK
jgi:uncharacterized membrane protein HdeD (DUF308 family)